jgi:carbamate kinase
MGETVVVLVNGEVLANGQGSRITDQRNNAGELADGLLPLFRSELKVTIMHGNKPQVGFVLFRSELASHVLHTIPLDVCGADTQGATGYMLSQAIMNALSRNHIQRRVMCMLTQTLVDTSVPSQDVPVSAIGPWFDRDKAEQYRQTRGWIMVEDPGRGYRRAVPSYPPKEILEIEVLQQLVGENNIVIAGGGGGIPVVRSDNGEYHGIEAVVETEQIACLMAKQLNAGVLLSVIERDNKFILSGLSTETRSALSVEELDGIIAQEAYRSKSVQRLLAAASNFLHDGGERVVVTTLRKLSDTLRGESGLWIGAQVGSPEAAAHLFQNS